MPRVPRARACPGGLVYHVLNRGNERRRIFHKAGDARAFVNLMWEAKRRVPGVRVLGFCLMANHWHLVLWPRADGELTAFMAWLTNTHVRRHRRHYRTDGTGHLYQGRFKSFPVESDDHLLRVLRYVEANPVRADLVTSAANWRWSSLALRNAGNPGALLDDWPVDRPADWLATVDAPMDPPTLDHLQTCAHRGRPYGTPDWTTHTAHHLGLLHSLRPRGRPKKPVDET